VGLRRLVHYEDAVGEGTLGTSLISPVGLRQLDCSMLGNEGDDAAGTALICSAELRRPELRHVAAGERGSINCLICMVGLRLQFLMLDVRERRLLLAALSLHGGIATPSGCRYSRARSNTLELF
jgi:hypothetical protein